MTPSDQGRVTPSMDDDHQEPEKEQTAAESIDEAVADVLEIDTLLTAERDRVLRLQAEMENVRQRTAREVTQAQRYAAMPLLRELLEVVDSTELAIEAAEQQEENAGGLLEGFRMVHSQLTSVLTKNNCKIIAADGKLFDPNLHEAILQQATDEVPPGHVAMVTKKGYTLHDRVVRPAQVIVAADPTTSAE